MGGWWRQAVARIDALDRRWHNALRRCLGVALIALFLGSLALLLFLWFKRMQPYPE